MSDKATAPQEHVVHNIPAGEFNHDWKKNKAHMKGLGHSKEPSNRCVKTHHNAWHEEPMRDHAAHHTAPVQGEHPAATQK
mmetsp:Transcript_35831/g.90522  ORF Transcript_35831/g.90522 Transcript_35831/m.90522 type:complete len:80 (-) Transcript_35831:622-861(-)|eukprot:CAMPEP_0202866494 /NCGR_PEP_ID=MMETSP1391-20130828/7733_1 /ASSEMBLY_ACC=CAM_ASM_000867 /TAXON_ID=1034604 /ORGANISM="Chlamydomonas leiostraca, Strain SAG 11-49" /LENGTH=79 /DNA_ID=CAMNT_0049546447 /DNA_START=96 /DNA_END=335 /DNA_ORIENTATION=+